MMPERGGGRRPLESCGGKKNYSGGEGKGKNDAISGGPRGG